MNQIFHFLSKLRSAFEIINPVIEMRNFFILLFTICSCSQVTFADEYTWSMPVRISTAGATASDPKVVIDANGNATAIWIESGIVKASSLPAGMTWSTPPTSLSGAGASSPRLGIDSSGNVTAIWLEAGVVEAASLPFGGSWSAETALSGAGTATSPDLAVDTSGNAIAVWVQSGSSIQSATKLAAGSWPVSPDTISGSTSSPTSPSISIGANGTVIAVWHALSSSNDVIYSASKTISVGTWGSPLSFFQGTATFMHNYPQVIVDANGNATAIWLRYNFSSSIYQNITVLSSSLPVNSASWSIPSILTTGGEILDITKISKQISVDTNGNVIAFWSMSYDASTYNVEASTKPNGGSWLPLQSLWVGVLFPYQVGVTSNNSTGSTLAAYMMFDGSSIVIKAHEGNISIPRMTGWKMPITISAGADNGYPWVATSLNGQTLKAVAVWVNFDNVSNVIVAATASKSTIAPPTNLAVSQSTNNYNIFTEYSNMISWTPSISSNIAAYIIYRNGIYFTSVDYFISQIVDHNAANSGTVTYGVSALDNFSSVSPPAQFPFTPP